jgi:hypothetical protein
MSLMHNKINLIHHVPCHGKQVMSTVIQVVVTFSVAWHELHGTSCMARVAWHELHGTSCMARSFGTCAMSQLLVQAHDPTILHVSSGHVRKMWHFHSVHSVHVQINAGYHNSKG